MKLEKALEELGLGKTKGTVYLAALEVGSGSVQEIAAHARLPRTTVHEVVRELAARGLISRSVSGKRSVYSAETPNTLANLLQEKERLLAAILPELNSRLNTARERPCVRYYDGVVGVRAIFEDTLTVSTPLLCSILSISNLYELAGHEFMDAYVPRRIKAGIQLNVVRSHETDVHGERGELWPSSKQELRELRYTPANLHFAMTMYFYDNKVAIVGTKQEPFGMIIESKEFFRTQKQLFELLWAVSGVDKDVIVKI